MREIFPVCCAMATAPANANVQGAKSKDPH